MTREIVVSERRRTLGLLGLVVLLFGTAWPVMKVGLVDATPIWFAAVRAGLGTGVSFALLAALGRLHRPTRADWPIIGSIGVAQKNLEVMDSLVASTSLAPVSITFCMFACWPAC
mgnify:CR=1 FL=1